MKIKTINPASQTDWQAFLSCGQKIRKRNSGLEFNFWKDNVQNDHILNNKTVFWVASNGKSEGRLGAFLNKKNTVGHIGWYECDEDETLSKALFEKAYMWFLKNSCFKITGPINGSSWHQYRFNTSCGKPLFPGDPFQPKHYVRFWKNEGFKTSLFYHSTKRCLENAPEIDLKSVSEIFNKMGLSLKPFNEMVYQNNKTNLHKFLQISFTNNPLFTPIKFEQFCSIYDFLPASIPTGFSYILFDKNNYPAGLAIAYPEPYLQYYQKAGFADELMTMPKLIIKTVAVHPDWQNRKICSLLVKLLHGVAKKKDISHAIHALMFMDNRSSDISCRKFKSDSLREYAVFEKTIIM